MGVNPNGFTKAIVEAMVAVNKDSRPVIFALSNPKTQADITSSDCYNWSNGAAIYGSGTKLNPVMSNGQLRQPCQVIISCSRVHVPWLSMGEIACQRRIPESLFLASAVAVAESLTEGDMKMDRVVPHQQSGYGHGAEGAGTWHCEEEAWR